MREQFPDHADAVLGRAGEVAPSLKVVAVSLDPQATICACERGQPNGSVSP